MIVLVTMIHDGVNDEPTRQNRRDKVKFLSIFVKVNNNTVVR
jgi:hypothetical protein